MIIARYITKEIIWTFVPITGILLLIALSNRFAVFLAKAATGELPVGLVFHLVWLYIPELLSFLLPLSFFLGILFAYGRLHADSEMTVLSSCGVSWGFISRLTLIISLVVMILVGMLTLWAVPTLSLHREQALSEGEALAVIQSMVPGRFQTLGEGNLVFYVEDIQAKNKTLEGVFIAEPPLQAEKKGSFALITANEAHIEKEAETKSFYLVLNDGYRYQGLPGTANYNVIQFKEYGRAVQQETTAVASETKAKSTESLADSSVLADLAELQWRISIALSVPILALLAIPLARVRPRYGRFAKFLPAIILYIIYYNLFTLSKRWIISKILPTSLGLWWVHGVFLMIALMLLSKESGWFRSLQAKKAQRKNCQAELLS